MKRKIEKIKSLRLYLLKQVSNLTVRQFNHIPIGHNNNIAWNLAHMNAAVQNMCYARSGLPFTIDDNYISPFLPGTKPERFIEEPELNTIRELFINVIDRLQTDVAENIFTNYSPSVKIPLVYGFQVNNIDEAIDYLLYHEGYHAGCITAFKPIV